MRRSLVVGLVGLFLAAAGQPAAAAATALLVSQSTAFAVLGHSCGGIQEQSVASGFDPTTGYPTGNVYVQTRCGGSGRGGGYHTTTYSAWLAVTWDLTGAVVSAAPGAPAGIDPSFTAFDGAGNELFNQLNAVNVLPADCSVGNTTYCSYRAYLALASGFVPPPRVTGISVTTGPATGNTSVAITGTGLSGATAVGFGAAPAASFTVNGDTSITAVSPATSAGTVDVTVTTAGGTSPAVAGDEFTFVAAPSVSGVSPDNGPIDGGTLVTITGANLVDVLSVTFGDTAAGFTPNDDGSITAVSPPAEATDTVQIIVVTIGGASAATAASRFTYTPSAPASVCGDGIVDVGEECDDGPANGTSGDCCAATCVFEAAGTACADDGSLCTADVCDGAGACVHPAAPSFACTPPDVAAGGSLLLRSLASGASQVQLKWAKGPVVALADFGDPTADVLELCVYDTTPGGFTLVADDVPSASGGIWTQTATGWKLRSPTGTSVVLKAGANPLQAKIAVKVVDPSAFGPLPLQADPGVVAQLRTSPGACWGATFSTPTSSTATLFKAKSD